MPDAAAPNALVSVIVPIYNGEAFLADCIESVLGQSYPYLELLLADDGSSDRSAEICAQYALRDARIKFLRLPHSGVSAARNAALAQARGDYFFFLDCDDLLHPEGCAARSQRPRLPLAVTRNDPGDFYGYGRFQLMGDWRQDGFSACREWDLLPGGRAPR